MIGFEACTTDDLIDRREVLKRLADRARIELTETVNELRAIEEEVLRRLWRERKKRRAA